MARRFLGNWVRSIIQSEEPRERVMTWILIGAGLIAPITATTPIFLGSQRIASVGVIIGIILFSLITIVTGILAWVRTPRLDIVFDPEDPACILVTQDSNGRTKRMYRVRVVNGSGSTVKGVEVSLTQHSGQGSSILRSGYGSRMNGSRTRRARITSNYQR